MNFQIFNKILMVKLAGAALLSVSAQAEMAKREPITINFNQMIEQSSEERSKLESKITTHFESEVELDFEEEAQKESQKVIDFVEYEVHLGTERKLVDRRFNSASETAADSAQSQNRVPNSVNTQPVIEPESVPQMQVTLIKKAERDLPN